MTRVRSPRPNPAVEWSAGGSSTAERVFARSRGYETAASQLSEVDTGTALVQITRPPVFTVSSATRFERAGSTNDHGSGQGNMRTVETIDQELRNLASLRWVLRESNATRSSLAEVVDHVDELLDERHQSSECSA